MEVLLFLVALFPSPFCQKGSCHKDLILFVTTMTQRIERM